VKLAAQTNIAKLDQTGTAMFRRKQTNTELECFEAATADMEEQE
jgi:hypothetical protein